MTSATKLGRASESPRVRWQAAITAADLISAGPKVDYPCTATASLRELNAIITQATAKHFVGVALQARLALAEMEVKSGKMKSGRAHLAEVRKDAGPQGFKLAALEAAELSAASAERR